MGETRPPVAEQAPSSAFSDIWDPYGVAQEQMVQEARERAPKGLDRRERIGEAFTAVAFLITAVLMVDLLPTGRPLAIGTALVLVAAYAIASRIKFEVGTG